MVKRLMMVLFACVLAVSFSTVTFAQESTKQEAKKEEKKEEKQSLKSVACDPKCGFMVRSHDEKELTAIVMKHAKEAHKMKMTDKEVKAMMKTEEIPAGNK